MIKWGLEHVSKIASAGATTLRAAHLIAKRSFKSSFVRIMIVAMARGFCVHPSDNVATMIDDLPAAGPVSIVGGAEVAALEPIALGHKIALRNIASGEPVIKFAVPIGRAIRDIRAGEWVHLHNCASGFDQRSQTLDVHSGAVTDTRYE